MPDMRVVPANEATWEQIQTVFGQRGDAAACQCQRFKHVGPPGSWWRHVPREELAERLHDQTSPGDPTAERTTGLVAFLDGEPVGWCAVEPRPAYEHMLGMPVPWKGRDEDKADESVWAVTCFVTRAGYRRRGVMRALAAASVPYARDRGARALEAYPMITTGADIAWGELHVGSRNAFVAAGMRQVSHPTKRRVVMRVDFEPVP